MRPGSGRSSALAAGLALLALSCVAADEPKPSRVALVIGNGAYKEAPLPNPIHDAQDVARALEESGFKVIRRENAGLREMHLALREFGDKLGRNTTGLFYFAGHGMQVKGRNYLLPVDADIAREDEVAFSALDLGAVLEKMDAARNPLNLVILDACRNNPFASRFQLTSTGLAQVDAPAGTLIAFATAPGSVAADGSGRNGLYTQYLVEEMKRPGLAVEEVFKGVRANVRRASQNKQVPWESTSLEGGFMFREAPRVAVAPRPPPEPAQKSASRATPVSLGAPPVFAKGDHWVYRFHNLLSNTERPINLRVKEVKGEEVLYEHGGTTDLVGNSIRLIAGDKVTLFSPSSQIYVFPMRSGAQWNLKYEQQADSRVFDNKVTLKVAGEEEVEVPAGKMRALRVERVVEWKEREKENAGTHTMTYWYNAMVKRPVLYEMKNVTAKGKVLLHERQELVRYDVR